jgi:hypothetical protein
MNTQWLSISNSLRGARITTEFRVPEDEEASAVAIRKILNLQIRVAREIREMVGNNACLPSPKSNGRPKESTARDVVEVLRKGPADGLSWSQWMKASGLSESTFKRRVKEALKAGDVVKDGCVYRRSTSGS